MNIKAFTINSDINEKEFYPENYIIDNTLDKDILNFFNSQKNNENSNQKKEIDNENEEEEEESDSELIYSSFPDNTSLIKKDIYLKMDINENIIKAIVDEYSKIKNKFMNNTNKDSKLEKDKFIFSNKEFKGYDNTPSDDFIKNKILPFKSNEYLMKNINKCFKVLKTFNKSNKKEINKLSQWIYTFLLFLETPLSPDNCADLYSINKYIYNNFMKSSELKIIFVIICEIFKQILII